MMVDTKTKARGTYKGGKPTVNGAMIAEMKWRIEAGEPKVKIARDLHRQSSSTVILHSDRGSQFRSTDYQRFLKQNMLICSMSAVGHCGDNAACEGFFGVLKRERTNRMRYPTMDVARADLFHYIERFHNPRMRKRIARRDMEFHMLVNRP